jgi:hypothetical protein
VCNHTFRGTGITAYLENGVSYDDCVSELITLA